MTGSHGLTCQEVMELVTEYLEDTLLEEVRKQLEEHIVGCPDCAISLQQMRETIVLLHQLAWAPVFPATKQKLLQLFRNWKQGTHLWERDSH